MLKVKEFEEYNPRRYSSPWIAKVTKDAEIDFSTRIGGYTGRYNGGEAGTLYISEPVVGQVYAYGQKDRRQPRNTIVQYIVWTGTEIKEISKTEVVDYLDKMVEVAK